MKHFDVAKVDPLNRHCQIVARRLGTGSVVPFLGAGANLCERPPGSDWEAEAGFLPSGAELADYLSTPYGYPETDHDLLRVAQWVDLVSSPRALVDELHAIFSRDYEPNKLHRFLAEMPQRLRAGGDHRFCGQLILTTNYDDVLERAFAEADERVDVVVYETTRERAAVRAPAAGRRARRDRQTLRRTANSRSRSAR